MQEADAAIAEGADCAGGIRIPSTRQTAQAYDLVGEAKRLVKSSGLVDHKPLMVTALAVREVLALMCCLGSDSKKLGSVIKFNASLIIAYNRALDPTLHSQMHLARNAIIRLGGDLGAFKIAVSKIYGRQVSDEDTRQLFSIYNTIKIASQPTKAARARSAKAAKPASHTQMQWAEWPINKGDPLKVSMPGSGASLWLSAFGRCVVCGAVE